MSLTGKWVNAYNSLMTLTQAADGAVSGEYISGEPPRRYSVLGYAGLTSPTREIGQPAALAIYWRARANSQGSVGGHWVSGLVGQLLLNSAGQPWLSLLHAIVATDAIPDLAAPATHVEKLTYLPSAEGVVATDPSSSSGEGASGVRKRFPKRISYANGSIPGRLSSSVELTSEALWGEWSCRENGAQLFLRPDLRFAGAVLGELHIPPGFRCPVSGFTDVYAWPDGFSLQSVSIAVLEVGSGHCMSLVGCLSPIGRVVGTLKLTGLRARATARNTTPTHDTPESWNFFWTRPVDYGESARGV